MNEGVRSTALALSSLMDTLAEATPALSEADLTQECLDAGEEPAAAAAATRALLLGAAKSYRQRHLRAAAEEYKRRVARVGTRWVDLPETPEARRAMLAALFARNPTMQTAYLTVQHREFKELSDADVESTLVQLAELGVFDPEEDERPQDPVGSATDDPDEPDESP